MHPSLQLCALSSWWPLPGHIDIVNTLCDIQELSVLQSVDWGALAFSIVLVELDGKNATKDTGVRHLLAAQGHVYKLVKVAPVPCQHSDPMLCTHPQRLRILLLLLTAKQPQASQAAQATVNTGVRWEHRRLLPRRDLAQRPPRQTSHA